jgi:hypothetical protein
MKKPSLPVILGSQLIIYFSQPIPSTKKWQATLQTLLIKISKLTSHKGHGLGMLDAAFSAISVSGPAMAKQNQSQVLNLGILNGLVYSKITSLNKSPPKR